MTKTGLSAEFLQQLPSFSDELRKNVQEETGVAPHVGQYGEKYGFGDTSMASA